MQVFNVFFKVLKKRYVSALIYIIVFLAISVAISKNYTPVQEFKESSLDIAVMDEDNTAASRALTDFIGKKNEIKSIENDREKLTELLYWETVDYVLIIREGYSDALTSGKTEGLFEELRVHDSFSSVYMRNNLNEYVKTAQAFIASGKSLDDALTSAAKVLSADTEVAYRTEEATGTEGFTKDFAGFFQYMPYILISVMLSSLGAVLKSVNSKKIRYRTDCSSLSPRKATVQIFAASSLFVLVVWLILMAAGVYVNNGFYSGNAWYAVLNSLIFTLIAAAIAIFISTFDLEENVATVITQIIGLGMSFICGIFVPQSFLGSGVLSAARFLPAYWYIKANDMLAGREAFDGSRLAIYLLIELAFAVVLFIFTLVVRRSKSVNQTA